MRRLAASLVLVVAGCALVVSACATIPLPRTGPRECRATSDCSAGNVCLFAVYASCDTPGSCFAVQDAQACVPQTACGCDGATATVCLVAGNSPAPVLALGSCDGATQQGFDASVPITVDSGPVTGGEDAADSFVPVPPADTGPPVQDAAPGIDAADANLPSVFGTPCQRNSDCVDPVYDQCGINGTCTKVCSRASECPTPPTSHVCDAFGFCE